MRVPRKSTTPVLKNNLDHGPTLVQCQLVAVKPATHESSSAIAETLPRPSSSIALDRILTTQVSTTQPVLTEDAIEKAHHDGRQDMKQVSIRLASSDLSSASHTAKVAYAHARGSVAGTCAESGLDRTSLDFRIFNPSLRPKSQNLKTKEQAVSGRSPSCLPPALSIVTVNDNQKTTK